MKNPILTFTDKALAKEIAVQMAIVIREILAEERARNNTRSPKCHS